jgi:hypothetical protein
MRRDWQRRLQRLEQAAAALPGAGPQLVVLYALEEGYAFHSPSGRRYDWAGRDTWPAWDDGQCYGSLAEAQAHLGACGVEPKTIVTVEYGEPPAEDSTRGTP